MEKNVPRSPINLEEVRSFLRRKEEKRQAVLEQRFRQAWRDFDAIVEHLIARHAPKRLWQWGSLLDRKRFSEISDIDIAIEGLTGPQEFFAVLGETRDMTAFPVDILEMESVGETNADYIRKTGRLVYEQGTGTDQCTGKTA